MARHLKGLVHKISKTLSIDPATRKAFKSRAQEHISVLCFPSSPGWLSPDRSIEIGKIFGLDITDAHFWKLGLKQYEHFLEELEKIVV